MAGLQNRNKTMGEAMTEMRSRLGFMTTGSASKANGPILKSFLQESHEYVFGELVPTDRKTFSTIVMQPGERLYDWHDDELDLEIDPGYVQEMTIEVSSNERFHMTFGITQVDRELSDQRQYPSRYDHTNGQIEVFPIPDQNYNLIVTHIAQMQRFDQMQDRPSVPYRLVFQYALALAKAHFRQPDATGIATTFNNMLAKAKARNRQAQRFIINTDGPANQPAQVVRTANGYQLRN